MNQDLRSYIIRGGWQLTPGHLLRSGAADGMAVILDAIAQGFRIFDCADIYLGIEELLGQVRLRIARRLSHFCTYQICAGSRPLARHRF